MLKAHLVRADGQDMNRIVLLITVVVALFVTGVSLAATPHRQNRRLAERNLLHATRMLARWHVGLVNPKTGLLLQNTTASCRGAGRSVAGRFASFRCVLHHGRRNVAVRYVALAKSGFEAHRL